MNKVTKRVLLVWVCVSIQVNVAGAFNPLNDPTLVAWWGFDEGTGTRTVDGSGQGNDATVNEAFNDHWYHVAGTYDGTQMKLYVNGMLGATMTSEGSIDSSPDAVNLGRNSEYPDRLFEGVLDDARIYNRVLSDAEILYLSNQ